MMKQLLVIGTIILAAGIILGTFKLMAIAVYAQQSAAPQNMTTTTNTTTTVTNTTAAGGAAAATNATTTNATAPQNMTTTTNTTTTVTNTTAAAGGAAAATNATTTTGIITNLTWFDGQVDQLSPENIQYQHTDPAFAKLAQTTADCLNDLNGIYAKVEANPQFSEAPGSATAYTPGDIQGQDQCTDVINQGVAQFCESTDSATFDSQKCQEAEIMTEDYVGVAEALFE
jgi:cytoskeletal protein RodZ